MNYINDIENLIKKRRSTRKYNDKNVEKNLKEELLTYAKSFECEQYRFAIVDYTMVEGEKLTTYGLIKNAKTLLIAIGSNTLSTDLQGAINFGYDFEHIILKATDLGLDTCWLGMSYNNKKLSNITSIKDNENIIMASPIGYGDKMGSVERLTRFVIKADKRIEADKLFFDKEFDNPIKNYLNNDYKKVLEMVRLAPSAGNAQPWRIVQTESGYDFYVVPKKYYENLKNKRIDFSYNDMGIAKMHFELGANKYNLKGKWITKDNSPISGKRYAFSWVTG